MKFGRSLPRNQVPEWASAYIDYKGLKQLIKAAADRARAGEDVDIAEFLFALDRNLEDVDSFYNKKFAETHRRLKLLQDRYGQNPAMVADLDEQESEELMYALLQLRNQLRNLQWFGEINRRGFVKITKKLDKKVPQTTTKTKERYIATMVDPKPFAKDTTIARLINELNKWIQILTDAPKFDDTKSTESARSARSLGRMASKALPSIPQAVLDVIDSAIRQNNVETLKQTLSELKLDVSARATQDMMLNLLQRSISSRSKSCIPYILSQVDSLYEPNDLNERNCIHRLVMYIGRTQSSNVASDLEPNAKNLPSHLPYNSHYVTPVPASSSKANSMSGSPTAGSPSTEDESVQFLRYVLDCLQSKQRAALSSRDSQGRIPLHYAAQYGIVVLCEILMAKMQEWGQFDVTDGIDAREWQDNEGNAPLHLAVIGGHPLTTKCLLKGEVWQGPQVHREPVSQSSAVLAMATRSNFANIVKMLVEAGVDINWQDATGETALHVAARFGHVECAKILIEGSSEQKADLELTEKSFSWNPLHIAAVDGHLAVAELLIKAGVNASQPDSFGWTAKEHAALRGHLKVAELLGPHTTLPTIPSPPKSNGSSGGDVSPVSSSPPSEPSSLGDRRSNGGARITDPVKSFGHRYLKNECLVMVSLGSMDMRKNDVEPVKLDRVPLAEAHTTQLDTALSLVISAQGAHGEPTTVDLPVHDNISTEPILFYSSDISKVKVLFDIVPTYSGDEKNKIGRAVALLSSVRPNVGTSRMNLQGDVCVPIMGSNLEVIGAVNFNFIVITPFAHPRMEINSQQTYWKKLASTMLIGHRGAGKNFLANKSLQLGENTVSSFIAAANLGAQYVEFDVQLTKDHVPVIYHDFLVSETGIDAPVHTLTLEQFLHINDGSNGRSRRGSPERRRPDANGTSNGDSAPGSKQRSLSVDYSNKNRTDTSLEERMKYTLNFKQVGYKANTRGNFVQAPFATLEELFKELPESLGFNIEIKYPMLLESEQFSMDTYAIELNSFCDTVLTKVYDLAKNRHIIFSSFNPDICLCLNFKQPSIPIMFLTDAGAEEVSDIRASSLQEAIRFASKWNLLGIVSNAVPLVNSPRLVKVVKQSGLVCVSYGTQNNNRELVQLQVNEGIDAVIVDNLLAIRQELTKEST